MREHSVVRVDRSPYATCGPLPRTRYAPRLSHGLAHRRGPSQTGGGIGHHSLKRLALLYGLRPAGRAVPEPPDRPSISRGAASRESGGLRGSPTKKREAANDSLDRRLRSAYGGLQVRCSSGWQPPEGQLGAARALGFDVSICSRGRQPPAVDLKTHVLQLGDFDELARRRAAARRLRSSRCELMLTSETRCPTSRGVLTASIAGEGAGAGMARERPAVLTEGKALPPGIGAPPLSTGR